MDRRRLVGIVLLFGVACTGTAPVEDPAAPRVAASPTAEDGVREPRGPFEAMVCDLPPKHVERIWHGYYPDRSGHIQFVPVEPNFVGAWLSHSGPWSYLQRVPLLFYGPPHVPAAEVNRPVSIADVAPTMGELLGFEFEAPDGEVLPEAVAGADRPPRIIVVIVWDAVGRNVLDEHPRAWPNLRRLMEEGAWFENATIGTSPSVTPSVHTTLGTGAYPHTHGIVDIEFGGDDGRMVDSKLTPQHLLVPALADLYAPALDNEPKIAAFGEQKMLGMIGHGALWEGGEKHISVPRRGTTWALEGPNAEFFRLPEYLNDVPGLDEAVRALDLESGRLDGTWLGEQVLIEPSDITVTPAYVEWQTSVVEELIRRERFGADDVPDLLYLNYKSSDEISHRWSMNSPQMRQVLRATDAALGRLLDFLDEEVGAGESVVVVTADHGSTPSPEVSGAFVINPVRLEQDIEETFGEDVVRRMRVTQMWLDLDRLDDAGHTIKEVARFVADYTKGQNRPAEVPEAERDEKLFEAAFPSAALENAPCLPDPDA